MRIDVVGIGGVGGYFGGKLARHYASDQEIEVIYIARGEHLRQIQMNGLQQITEEGQFTAFPTLATDNPENSGPFDLVLFCVKGYDLESSAALIKKNIGTSSIVISMLNGVDNVRPLTSMLPDARVLNGCVYIGAHIVKPGVVRQAGGSCQLLFGPDDGNLKGLNPIKSLLKRANINAVLQRDIQSAVWEKYLFVSPLASATTYLGQPFGEFVTNSESRKFLEGLMKEVVDIGSARGIEISDEMIQGALDKISFFPYDTKTSMQMDFENSRRTEIDIFTGYIVSSGKELGIQTPLHKKVYQKLKKSMSF
ncbi:ketopantoate reductase family protein [Thermodesulfobacteriota bacterium]